MKKLELKHLAPYLPYGLKMKSDTMELPLVGFIGELLILNDNSNEVSSMISETFWKPILKPLSDLTKFREFCGKSQIFMECYFSISAQEETDFYNNGTIPEYWQININMLTNGDYKHLDYWIIQKLFEWHFDVFGLIPKGLAIDINTLK